MSRDHEYESEMIASREQVATMLSGVADGVLTGSVRLGDGDDAIVVDTPDEMTLEVEFETEDDELSLELELEWSRPEGEESVDESAGSLPDGEEEEDEGDEQSAPVGAGDASRMQARFELFRDRSDEWRWRLRHRNGNIIATSGEGYTRKHNARKGLRSVVQNAPEAEVVDDGGD